jgi:ubiquinol-cytochrome c reductase cytochrome b subunit
MSIWGNRPTYILKNRKFSIKLRSIKRIGAHNKDIIIFGSLLGDGYAEKHGLGTRISFYQENTHQDYLLWLNNLIATKGYCNPLLPQLTKRLGQHGKLRNVIRFKTYISFNNNKKILPPIYLLDLYLTPLALAIWIMDDGSIFSSGMKLATNNFTKEELLSSFLNNKYLLSTRIHSAGKINQYSIYIPKKDLNKIHDLILPYIHPSMKYKLHLN